MKEILVKLADKFDQEGKRDLASEVDALLINASRPLAPLKSMNEDVKKDLLKFIHNVQGNIGASMESLGEFFRRLRYFDQAGTIKDLKLDRTLKELQKILHSVDDAGKSLYALSYGKHPSKSDLEQMADDFGPSNDKKTDPLEFFNSQRKTEEAEAGRDEDGLRDYENELYPDEDEGESFEDEDEDQDESFEDEDIDDDELGQFWDEDGQ